MTPAVQQVMTLLVLCVSLGYIGWRVWQAFSAARRKEDGCGPDCHCDDTR